MRDWRDEGYTVEPLTGYDHAGKDCDIDLRYIVSGLLDPNVMVNALYDLIEKRWPCVGSRLQYTIKKTFELHIPNAFGTHCPPMLFDVYDAEGDTPLSECFKRLPDFDKMGSASRIISFKDVLAKTPAASKLLSPYQLQAPRAKGCSASLFESSLRESKTRCNSDAPLVMVVLYRFPCTNETVVQVVFPHIVFDTCAMGDFMRAWSSSVNGLFERIPEVLPLTKISRQLFFHQSARDSECHQFANSDYNAMTKINCIPPAENIWLAVSKLSILVLGMMWRAVVLPLLQLRKPRCIRPIVTYIPQSQLQSWRISAMRARPPHIPPETTLSDGDLIISWLVSTLSETRRSWLNGVFCVLFPVNLRLLHPQLAAALQLGESEKLHSKVLWKARKAVLHNLLSFVYTPGRLWCSQKADQWGLAWTLRERINELRTDVGLSDTLTKTAVVNNMSYYALEGNDSLNPVFLGERLWPFSFPPHQEPVIATNWLQSGLMEAVNFEAAVRSRRKSNVDVQDTTTLNLDGATSESANGCASDMFMQPLEWMTTLPGVVVMRKNNLGDLFLTVAVDEDLSRRGRFGPVIDII